MIVKYNFDTFVLKNKVLNGSCPIYNYSFRKTISSLWKILSFGSLLSSKVDRCRISACCAILLLLIITKVLSSIVHFMYHSIISSNTFCIFLIGIIELRDLISMYVTCAQCQYSSPSSLLFCCVNEI